MKTLARCAFLLLFPAGAIQASSPTQIGAAAPGSDWVLDQNGSYAWEGPPVDGFVYWTLGQSGEVPVTGDWNGDGRTKIGVYFLAAGLQRKRDLGWPQRG